MSVGIWLIPHHCRRYKGWSEAVGKAGTSVAVLYCDAYGFCDRLSQTLARGITKANVATEMVDLLSTDAQVRVIQCDSQSQFYHCPALKFPSCDACESGDRLSQTLARGINKANVATEMVDLLSTDAQVQSSFMILPARAGLSCGMAVQLSDSGFS